MTENSLSEVVDRAEGKLEKFRDDFRIKALILLERKIEHLHAILKHQQTQIEFNASKITTLKKLYQITEERLNLLEQKPHKTFLN